MDRMSMSVLVTGACLVLGACGGNNGIDREAAIVLSHTTQLEMGSGPSVSGLRDNNGDLTAIDVGDTRVLLSQEIDGVSGGGERETVGPILGNENVIVRHISAHWNMQTDVVAEFDHLSYGAWATGTRGNDGRWNYESVGDAYLTALDDARTSAADMPMSGTATYLGQFTGFVQGHGVDGKIIHTTGDVEMTADFANAEMTVDMLTTSNYRVVLGGAIQDNEFSGTSIHQLPNIPILQAQGATARLAGGFYGEGAVEAGGVFEVVGGRTQDPGRSVGAFGGRKAE